MFSFIGLIFNINYYHNAYNKNIEDFLSYIIFIIPVEFIYVSFLYVYDDELMYLCVIVIYDKSYLLAYTETTQPRLN